MAALRVRIVDDDALIRLILRRTIRHQYPAALVISAATLAQACQLLAAGTPTIILTDFHLTHGTGLDILRAARAQDAALPVIVVSADVTIVGPATAAGATAFLAKPFDLTAFVRVVQRFC